MWRMINYISIGAFLIVLIAIEVVRSIVHRHREKRYGMGGGTQDIAMWGSFIACLLLVLGAISGVLCWFGF